MDSSVSQTEDLTPKSEVLKPQKFKDYIGNENIAAITNYDLRQALGTDEVGLITQDWVGSGGYTAVKETDSNGNTVISERRGDANYFDERKTVLDASGQIRSIELTDRGRQDAVVSGKNTPLKITTTFGADGTVRQTTESGCLFARGDQQNEMFNRQGESGKVLRGIGNLGSSHRSATVNAEDDFMKENITVNKEGEITARSLEARFRVNTGENQQFAAQLKWDLVNPGVYEYSEGIIGINVGEDPYKDLSVKQITIKLN